VGLLRKLLAEPLINLRRIAAASLNGSPNGHINDSTKKDYGMRREYANGRRSAQCVSDIRMNNIETEFDSKSQETRRIHDRLRQMQFELMRQEKMSMLGHLIGGVAHEVNTPAGAILNASIDAGHRLRRLLTLAMSTDALSDDSRQMLLRMFDSLYCVGTVRNDMASRSERRQIEQQLQQAGYEDARRISEILVAYGMQGSANENALIERLIQEPIMTILEDALALKASCEISESSAKKITRITHALRLYNHSNNNEPVGIDINESIDNMLVIMQNKIKQVAKVETHYDSSLPLVKCGADLLQVWTNILSNACDAIDLARHGQLGLIEIVTEMDDENVVAKISNNGLPILPEHMNRLFTPFFTTKGLGRGVGLGLSICAGIVKRYGGTIAAANDSGRVVFEVRLPRRNRCPDAEAVVGSGSV